MNLHVHWKDCLSQNWPSSLKEIFSVKPHFMALLVVEEKNIIMFILLYKSNAWLLFECAGLAFKLSLGKRSRSY